VGGGSLARTRALKAEGGLTPPLRPTRDPTTTASSRCASSPTCVQRSSCGRAYEPPSASSPLACVQRSSCGRAYEPPSASWPLACVQRSSCGRAYEPPSSSRPASARRSSSPRAYAPQSSSSRSTSSSRETSVTPFPSSSGRHALQASAFSFAHASPHPVPLVATKGVVQTFDTNGAVGTDPFRLPR